MRAGPPAPAHTGVGVFRCGCVDAGVCFRRCFVASYSLWVQFLVDSPLFGDGLAFVVCFVWVCRGRGAMLF